MKFLANENFPFPSIQLLRSHGFDIKSIAEESYGITDLQVIGIAKTQNRIILTFDLDYGELIFKYSAVNPPAAVYFRHKGLNPLSAGETLLKFVESSSIQMENCFTVIEKTSIRQRKYL